MLEPSLRKSLLMFQVGRRVAYGVFVWAPQADGTARVDGALSLRGLYGLPDVLGRFRLLPFREAAFPARELVPDEMQLWQMEARSIVRMELRAGPVRAA